MKKYLIFILTFFIILIVLLYIILINGKNELELQIGIGNQDIDKLWDNVKEKLKYDKYFITDIKSDGIECILVNQNNEIIIDEMNIEIGGYDKGKLNIYEINANSNQTKIKKVTEIKKISEYTYNATQILSKLSLINLNDIINIKTENLNYRLEYKGFIKKDSLVNKSEKTEITKYILNENGNQINLKTLINNYDNETELMCFVLTNLSKTSEYIEIYIIM